MAELRTPAYPTSVRIVEVGPRDGLQNENKSQVIPTEAKVSFINKLSDAGLRDIEVGSFVSPSAVPQMADSTEVLSRIEIRDGVRYLSLVPNLKGLDRWMEASHRFDPTGVGICLFTAASETFNRKNTNMGVKESIETFAAIVSRLRSEAGAQIPFLRGYVSTAVRCPYEGLISPERVASVTRMLLDIGVDEISIGDTIGAATPADIERLLEAILKIAASPKVALHLHDTRGTALANVLVAMRFGIQSFDSSAGGLGGCPFAPGAAGNLATEDLLYMLNGMGIETGVDLGQIASASALIAPNLEHSLPSKELQALNAAGF